jgi:hypothetical protein
MLTWGSMAVTFNGGVVLGAYLSTSISQRNN